MIPALALLAGITVGWRIPALVAWPVLTMSGVVWVWALLSLTRRAPRVFVVATTSGFLVVGGVLGTHATVAATDTTLWHWHEQELARGSDLGVVVVDGRLLRDAAPTDYGATLVVAAEQLGFGREWVGVSGGIRVTVSGQFVADRVHGWTAGRRLRIPMTLRPAARYDNPGVPDRQRGLMWRGTSLLGSVKSALLVEIIERGSRWSEGAAALRATVRRLVDRSVGAYSLRSAGIVTAILIGDRAGLDDDTQRRLQEAGTYHVIAISGGNIAILAAALLLGLRLTGVSARLAATATIGCLLAYAQVVGSEASAARATFAAVTCLAARTVDHRSSPLKHAGAVGDLSACRIAALGARYRVSPDVRSHTGDFRSAYHRLRAQRRVHDVWRGAARRDSSCPRWLCSPRRCARSWRFSR